MLKITASTLTFTNIRSCNNTPIKENLKKRHKVKGFSVKSRKQMLNRLRNFMFFRQYEFVGVNVIKKTEISNVTFLTTTLPSKQIHTDLEIKKVCLDNFMNKLRYHCGKFSYVWKAEAQLNGNIHFHFIIDLYIDKKLCDKLWHDSIELLGYVTSFEKKFGHRNPPTNKIERADSLKKVIGYATKYIAKIDSGRVIDGQVWYSSKDLQTNIQAEVTMRENDERLIKRKLRNLGLYCVSNEYCEKFYLQQSEDIENLPLKLRSIYKDVIRYHLGRKECESGMEREYKIQEVAQLREYQPKRKLQLQGYEIFKNSLFQS